MVRCVGQRAWVEMAGLLNTYSNISPYHPGSTRDLLGSAYPISMSGKSTKKSIQQWKKYKWQLSDYFYLPLLCFSNSRGREGPVEFLRFHIYTAVHPITTGMNPIRNMNHKRKYQLNQSQEYQLQYLLPKEESFQ